MKMLCRVRTQLNGEIIREGKVVEVEEKDLNRDVIRAYFERLDDQTHAVERAQKDGSSTAVLVAGLSREAVIQKLRSQGQKVPHNMSNEALKARFLEFFDVGI